MIDLESKDCIKRMLLKLGRNDNFGALFLINSAIKVALGSVSMVMVYPFDLVWTNFMLDQYSGFVDFITKTVNGPDNFLGLYKGFGVSVIGIIPYRGLYFGLNDTLKLLTPCFKGEDPILKAASKFVVAQLSVVAAGLASYPFGTVRYRLSAEFVKAPN